MVRVKRRKRSDRMYVIYRLTNKVTGDTYVGLSAMVSRSAKRTLKVRLDRHMSKARTEAKDWDLHVQLRLYHNVDFWDKEVIGSIRGRKNAYALERKLISRIQPNLNVF